MGAQSSRLVRQASVSKMIGKKHSSNEVNYKRTIVNDQLAVIQYPCQSSTWIRGSPVCIQWSVIDSTVLSVRLDLCQIGSSATTVLIASAPNTGLFVLERVPWGVLGDGFYIRLTEDIVDYELETNVSPRYTLSETFTVATSRWQSPADGKKSNIPTPIHRGLVRPTS